MHKYEQSVWFAWVKAILLCTVFVFNNGFVDKNGGFTQFVRRKYAALYAHVAGHLLLVVGWLYPFYTQQVMKATK